MIDFCSFCQQNKKLTTHHLIAKKYQGGNDIMNVRPDICGNCHKKLEDELNKTRGNVGAGSNITSTQSFNIGSVQANLNTGSVLLDNQSKVFIDVGSPFYGMSCHIKDIGQRNIEASLSGGSVVLITGFPGNSWLIYSYANSQNASL